MSKEFPKGLIVKRPKEGSPDFVKLQISIKIGEFQEFLSTKQTEWLNIDVKKSKEGKLYAEVNDWKPEKKADKPSEKKGGGIVDDDIPFAQFEKGTVV